MYTTALLLVPLAALAAGQMPKLGPCPENVQPMSNFNANQFNGKWYSSWTTEQLYQFGTMCQNIEVGRADDGSMKVQIESASRYTPSIKATMYAAPTEQRQPGLMDMMYTKRANDNDIAKQIRQALGSGLYMLGTDYRSYAVTYYCIDYKLFHVNLVEVYSRQPGQGGVPLSFGQDTGSSSQYRGSATYNNPYVRVQQPYNAAAAGGGNQQQPDPNTSVPNAARQALNRLPRDEFEIADLVPVAQTCE